MKELNDGLGADTDSTEAVAPDPGAAPGGSTTEPRLPSEDAITYLARVGFADADEPEYEAYSKRLLRLTSALEDSKRTEKIRRFQR